MGQPPSAPQKMSTQSLPSSSGSAYSHPLSAQHERLILELLPFNDSASFHDWLQSETVRGSFNEFTRDLLQHTRQQHVPDPHKEQTAKAAKDAIDNKAARFLLYHPDKSGWTEEDHHVRFIVTVVMDNVLTKTLSLRKEGTLQVVKSVYEVLCYLKASLVVAEQNPPGYSQ